MLRVIVAGAAVAVATIVLVATASAHVEGTATITSNDDGSTTVVIHVSGFDPNTEHVNHIHVGPSCESPGEHMVTLNPLIASSDGDATATTEVTTDDSGADVTFDSITNGSRVIVIHRGPNTDTDENKEHLACGAIPASNGATEVVVEIDPVEEGMDHAHEMPATGTGGPTSGGSGLAFYLASALAIAGLTAVTSGLVLRRRTATTRD